MGALVLVGDNTAYQFFAHKGAQFPTARPGWKEMWDVVRHCIAPPTRQGAGADAGVLVQRMQVRVCAASIALCPIPIPPDDAMFRTITPVVCAEVSTLSVCGLSNASDSAKPVENGWAWLWALVSRVALLEPRSRLRFACELGTTFQWRARQGSCRVPTSVRFDQPGSRQQHDRPTARA